ncbi:protocadherin alpha-5-like isoform X21 [Alosa alosa]|uniref:protocadherin alpha-5-like isoform X21 n=1 Tax=Alosa alosa TaxID=278164 RepID=UPI0020151D7F|nr:protocadherin alpha-5-like isoform X21 [Alosa alosa]
MALTPGNGCHLWIFFAFAYLWSIAFGQIAYTLSEETNPGTTVGNLAKDFNLDIGDLERRGFQIVSGANTRYFNVNVKTGILSVRERIDREQLCGSSGKCALPLEAIVNSPLNIYRFEVNVLDINDNDPTFSMSDSVLNISESSFVNERFPLPIAHDRDIGSNSVKSYRLSPNEYFSLDVQSGGERVTTELVLRKALDRETQAVIQLSLTAVDGGKPPRSETLPIRINVGDVNDNIPVFSKSLYKIRMPENAAPGTSVITVSATDVDEGQNGDIVYTFLTHENDKETGDFSINSETGVITVSGDLDYEKNSAVEIRVQAKDKGHSPRAAHCKVLIEISDVNDNIPKISVTSLVNTVKEDAPVDTIVGMITVLDDDSGKNGEVRVKIQNNVPFVIKNSYKNYYSLLVNGPLDREKAIAYNVTITAIDEGTPPLSSTSVITVRVSDVNDNAPQFPDPVINIYMRENSQVGGVIYTVSAFDADSDVNAKISYSLLEDSSKALPVMSMINVNADSGDIYALQSLNYEEIKMFHFKIQAKDSGDPPLSSNATVHVFILDENDNSPRVLPPYSEHGPVNSENIPYSAEAGYFVAKIRAVDADSGYNALLSYHISEPKGNNLFRIGTSNGEIRTKRRMSDNDLKTHPLIILISDNGEPSLSATVSIEVVVMESIELQTKLRHSPMKDDSFSDLNMYLLVAIASVSVIFLLSLISLIAVKCHRTDSSFNSYSAPVITTHPDGSWSYSKSTQQYDVCFSSDTLKSDVVVFPTPFPPADAELISINEGDTFVRTQTLPNKEKASGGRPMLRQRCLSGPLGQLGFVFITGKKKFICPPAPDMV